MYIFLEINWDTNSLVFTLSYSDNTIDSVPYHDDAYTTYQKSMLNLNKVCKLLSQKHLGYQQVWTDTFSTVFFLILLGIRFFIFAPIWVCGCWVTLGVIFDWLCPKGRK
jgi:hypothetical protein